LAQTSKTLNIFKGDQSGQYGYKGQLIDYSLLTLILAGMIYSFIYKRRLSLYIWFWLISIVILSQILTTIPSPIFLPRFVIGIPVLFFFAAYGLTLVEQLTKNYVKKTVLILICIMLI